MSGLKSQPPKTMRAQYELGLKYDNGEGVATDKNQAMAWYQQSANQGYAKAQYNLGTMYRLGEGVAKDDAKAAY